MIDDVKNEHEMSNKKQHWSLVKYRFLNNIQGVETFTNELDAYDFSNYDNFRP